MNRKSLLLVAALGFFAVTVPGLAAEKFTPKPVVLTASDLAEALGLRWWKYQVKLAKPAHMVTVTVHEMRRKKGGGWLKEQKIQPMLYRALDSTFQEVTVTVVIPEDKAPLVSLRLGGGGGFGPTRGQAGEAIDFKNMFYSNKNSKMVDGCIVLGAEYQNSTATDREEDMVRILGLEIDTE